MLALQNFATGLCAEIGCYMGEKDFRVESAPFRGHFGSLKVIFIKMRNRQKKFHNNSRAVSFCRYILREGFTKKNANKSGDLPNLPFYPAIKANTITKNTNKMRECVIFTYKPSHCTDAYPSTTLKVCHMPPSMIHARN